MNNKFVAAALALLLALGGWLGWYFSDKKVIERLVVGLAWDLSKEGQETTVQTAMKLREVKNVLAGDCLVLIPERSYSESVEKDLIIQYLMYHRNRYEQITISFENLLIDIPDKGEALVQTTVRLLKKKNQADQVEEVAQVELTLKKENKEWLLYKTTVPQVLID